jgi:hypothetical protein
MAGVEAGRSAARSLCPSGLYPDRLPGGHEMEYAFAPGTTKYDRRMRKLLTNRPNTELVQGSGLTTVADFLNHLSTASGVSLPAENLFLVSHGNDRAWMEILLDGSQPKDKGTDFEAVTAAVASKSVAISTGVNHDANGDLASMAVNIRGCRIGAAEPFMEALKEAFGNESPMTAPKHFHKVYELEGIGMFEFLVYSFTVISKTAYANKKAVVQAFEKELLSFRDGSAVPDANWAKWIPEKTSPGKRPTKAQYLNLGQTIAKQKRIEDEVEFRHKVNTYPYEVPNLGSMPAAADRNDKLRQALEEDPSFADTEPFPIYKRYGLYSIDEFVDELSWAFTWQASNSIMLCVGTQHEYNVLVPITDPPDLDAGTLIYNFYPPAGSSSSPVNNLLTTDDTMFYTSP